MTTLIDIRLPHMGSVERAVITAWQKSAGDKVAVDEPLLEVSTDKVETEIPSSHEGTLVQILAQPEDEVPVGEVIARLAPAEATEEEVAAALAAGGQAATGAAAVSAPPASSPAPKPPEAPRDTPIAAPSAAPAEAREDLRGFSLVLQAAFGSASVVLSGPTGPRTSPLVRRMAKEAGIDLRNVRGTGPGGRVTRADVQSHLDGAQVQAPAVLTQSPSAPVAPVQPAAVQAPLTTVASQLPAGAGPERPQGYEALPHEAVPHSAIRKAIAAHMVASVSTAPQLTAQVDVDFSRLTAVRADVNAARARRGLGKLSYLPFIARAVIAALGDHPDVNATFTETHLLRWQTVNLGVAVDADSGLYVPVVHDAQRLSLEGLADAIADLGGRVRERKLTAHDLEGGTFTISNSGSVGGVVSTPILTRPQVASLGVPAVVRQPVAVVGENGEEYVAIRPVARLGLTFDHRAFDGSDALRALLTIQRNLEEWSAEAYG